MNIIWVTCYAAIVGTLALGWQIISWRKSRRPDVVVSARLAADRTGEGVTVTVLTGSDVTIVRAGVTPKNWGWQRYWNEILVRSWEIGDQTFGSQDSGLPLNVRPAERLVVWFSKVELASSGIGYRDGKHYVAWVETSRGTRHKSNGFGGDRNSQWQTFS